MIKNDQLEKLYNMRISVFFPFLNRHSLFPRVMVIDKPYDDIRWVMALRVVAVNTLAQIKHDSPVHAS